MEQKTFVNAVQEIRKFALEKERTFDQTVDLIVNLKNFDVRRESFNTFITLPHVVKEKNVLGFLEKDSEIIDTIVKEGFGQFKEKGDFKKLLKQYDFFIANAKLMPSVATTFGRALGPAGKMPSPQLGIVPNEDEKVLRALLAKINATVRVRVQEPTIKLGIAKASLSDDNIAENALTAYQKVVDSLPKGVDQVRNVYIKFTMTKPVKVSQ